MQDELTQKICRMVVSVLGYKRKKILPDDDLITKYGADSLDAVDLLMMLEEEFDVCINDDEWARVTTCNDIISLLLKTDHRIANTCTSVN